MKYPNKKLCSVCKNAYHPKEHKMCWKCWATQPARITSYKTNKTDWNQIDGINRTMEDMI